MIGTTPDYTEGKKAAWQTKLLPLMSAILVAGGLFFAVMSIFEMRSLYERMDNPPGKLAETLEQLNSSADVSLLADPDYLRFRILATLESEALERRYHQASATTLARVWTRQLGFITGMLLALVGAAFILGRLSEDTTTLTTESKGVKASLETASPGIVLAVLGTFLMALAIWVPFYVTTDDSNLYMPGTVVLQTQGAATSPRPAPSEHIQTSDATNAPRNDQSIMEEEHSLFDDR